MVNRLYQCLGEGDDLRRSVRRRGPRRLGFGAVAVILLGMAAFFFAAGRLHARMEARRAVQTEPGAVRTVIVDPGHGGADGGAVGADGVVEKDINLAIALKLRDMLAVQGYEVLMTRETDVMTCDEGVQGIGKQKKSDMRNRLKLIQDHPGAVVLSIHQNLFEEEKYHGAQMFYGRNNPFSRELAQTLQEIFVKNLQPENLREIKKGEKDLYLLWQSENPIVLVECGFLSNREECARLQDEEYQGQVAFTILEGLMTALAAVS